MWNIQLAHLPRRPSQGGLARHTNGHNIRCTLLTTQGHEFVDRMGSLSDLMFDRKVCSDEQVKVRFETWNLGHDLLSISPPVKTCQGPVLVKIKNSHGEPLGRLGMYVYVWDLVTDN